MPRYRYQCQECSASVSALHEYKITLTDCDECDSKDTLKKILSVPFYGSKTLRTEKQQEVGDVTKEHIEANRELLKQQKKELKSKKHDKK